MSLPTLCEFFETIQASFRVDYQRLLRDFLMIILGTRGIRFVRPDRGLSAMDLPDRLFVFQFQIVLSVTPKVYAICFWLIPDSNIPIACNLLPILEFWTSII